MKNLRLFGLSILALCAVGLVGCHQPCDDDDDCFGRSVCVGSSVCPDDVECVWEGAPGVCGLPAPEACEVSGGGWEEASCGDYHCGRVPICAAAVPGCDCGPHQNFVEGVGCRPDSECRGECRWDSDCPRGFECEGSSVCPPDVVCIWEGEPGVCVASDAMLCRSTEGRWDDTACDHYQCGIPNDCEAIIPGCDCGPGANFVDGEGCVKDPTCEGDCRWDGDCEPGEICDGAPDECPHWLTLCPISEPPVLGTCVDGCWGDADCPDHQVCDGAVICPPKAYCIVPDRPGACVDGKPQEIDLCERTGGYWDPTSCGHRRCESDITCLAIIPGCDCGPTANFDPERGCVDEPACGPR